MDVIGVYRRQALHRANSQCFSQYKCKNENQEADTTYHKFFNAYREFRS